jgi:hypothetical protein
MSGCTHGNGRPDRCSQCLSVPVRRVDIVPGQTGGNAFMRAKGLRGAAMAKRNREAIRLATAKRDAT